MVGGIFIDFIIGLKKWNNDRKLKKAIAQANEMARLTKRKYIVIKHHKRFLVISKKELQSLIQKKRFTKGFDMQKAEKMALHITLNS